MQWWRKAERPCAWTAAKNLAVFRLACKAIAVRVIVLFKRWMDYRHIYAVQENTTQKLQYKYSEIFPSAPENRVHIVNLSVWM